MYREKIQQLKIDGKISRNYIQNQERSLSIHLGHLEVCISGPLVHHIISNSWS